MKQHAMPVHETGPSSVILSMISLLIVLVLTGCGPAVEKSSSFKAAVNQVERIDEDLKMGLNRLGRLDNSLDSMNTQINKLHRKWERVSPDKIVALEQRLDTIEQSLNTNLNTLVALNKRLDNMAKENRKQVVAMKKAKKSTGRVEARIKPENKAADRKTTRKVALAEPQTVKPSGFYYTLKQGESINDVASRYETTPSNLQKINRFPKGRMVMAGTQIYIPRR